MNEVMMVPVQDFTRLQDYYKGKLTENALLNKAGRLAAEQHLIMNNSNIPPSMAVKMVKPMAREQGKLVKRLRTGTSGPITYQGTAEPEGMVDAPVENLLKQILKGVKQEPAAAPILIQETPSTSGIKKEKKSTPSTSGIKKEKKSSKLPIPIKPSTSKKKGTTSKKSFLSADSKSFLRSLGIDKRFISDDDDDDDGGYSPKGAKGKKPKKGKKTAWQKLQEGWEEWDNPSKRKLEKDYYDTDSD